MMTCDTRSFGCSNLKGERSTMWMPGPKKVSRERVSPESKTFFAAPTVRGLSLEGTDSRDSASP
jgi:hypothetical protein